MSQDKKTTPQSSLSSITKPSSSPPVSPQLSSVRTSKTTSIIDSASNMNNAIEQRLNAFEVAQQKSATDINRLTSMMEMLIRSQSTMTTKVDDRINNNDTESQQQVVQSLNKQTTVDNSTTTQSKKFVQNETLSNRDASKDRILDASKSLFCLSSDKHEAIESYSNSKTHNMNMINQSFNLNESTIDMNETKLSDYVSKYN